MKPHVYPFLDMAPGQREAPGLQTAGSAPQHGPLRDTLLHPRPHHSSIQVEKAVLKTFRIIKELHLVVSNRTKRTVARIRWRLNFSLMLKEA